jgi:hypothetical protein
MREIVHVVFPVLLLKSILNTCQKQISIEAGLCVNVGKVRIHSVNNTRCRKQVKRQKR